MLTVICPSRGRPEAAAEVAQSFMDTATDLDTKLWFVTDPDDETRGRYPTFWTEPQVISYQLAEKPPQTGMLPALNMALEVPMIMTDEVTVVGFIGDDHRFRTSGWDSAIDDYLEKHPGVAYGDDLLQRERLPTQWFVSRKIVDVFKMGLPTLRHLYIDDYWKTFAMGAGCLYYMPAIVIEHMHPTAGKSEWDDSYRANNAPSMYEADSHAFSVWLETDYEKDVATLRQIVG